MTALNIDNHLDSYHGCLPEMPSFSDSQNESRSSSWRKSKVVVAVSPFIPTENSMPAPDRISGNKPSNFVEIKRKLAFDEEDDGKEKEELDFTDKLAALRTLFIKKQSIGSQQNRNRSSPEVMIKTHDQSNRGKDLSSDLKNSKQNDNVDRMKLEQIRKFSLSDFSSYKIRSHPNKGDGGQYTEHYSSVLKTGEAMFLKDAARNKAASSRKDSALKSRHKSSESEPMCHISLETAKKRSDSQHNLNSLRRSHSSNMKEYPSYVLDNERLNVNNNANGEHSKRLHKFDRYSQSHKKDGNTHDVRNSPKRRNVANLNIELVQSNLSSLQPTSPARESISDHSSSRIISERTPLVNIKDTSESVYIAELLQDESCYSLSALDRKQTNVEYYVGTSPNHKMWSSVRSTHHSPKSPDCRLHSSISPTRRRQTSERQSLMDTSNVQDSMKHSSVSPPRKKQILEKKPLMDLYSPSIKKSENRPKKFTHTSEPSSSGRHFPKKTKSDIGKLCIISPDKPLTLEELSDIGSLKFARHKQKYEKRQVSISKLESFADELRESEVGDCSRSDNFRTFEYFPTDLPKNVKKNATNNLKQEKNILYSTGRNSLYDSSTSMSDVSIPNPKQLEKTSALNSGPNTEGRDGPSAIEEDAYWMDLVNQGEIQTEQENRYVYLFQGNTHPQNDTYVAIVITVNGIILLVACVAKMLIYVATENPPKSL